MVKIKVVKEGIIKCLNAEIGTNLLTLLINNNYLINASCGGHGRCGKCKLSYQNKDILACHTIIKEDMEILLNDKYDITPELTIDKNFVSKVKSGWGIAIDVGTTTVAAYLMDLYSGKQIDSYARLNNQIPFGADVITRINKCQQGLLNRLNYIIINQINEIISYFKDRNQIEIINTVVIAGNTTMLHIINNIDPTPLGVIPFAPVFINKIDKKGVELNINSLQIILLPSISAYVGGDIVAGIIASSLENDNTSLLIDLGTNGEMVLKCKSKMYCCSTAAGPAFEGSNIELGMGGIEGAISKVTLINDKLIIKTISGYAKGICGSGLVDIIAILLKEKIIDETGAFNDETSSILVNNLHKDRFYLTNEVYITQKDIREFQLAKSAIHAGILTLLTVTNTKINDIDNVYLAGGFGFYLNKENALNLGIIPSIDIDKIISIGNSSGLGAKMCLLNDEYLNKCEKIAKQVETVDLSTSKVFMEYFVDNMQFVS